MRLRAPSSFLILLSCVLVMLSRAVTAQYATFEGDPSTVVNGVSTVTGVYTIARPDLWLDGPDTTLITAKYASNEKQWFLLPHTALRASTEGVAIGEHSGAFVRLDEHDEGLCNTARGMISGRTNPLNRQVEQFGNDYRIRCGDGSQRLYQPVAVPNKCYFAEEAASHRLTLETLPSGNQIHYHYNEEGHLCECYLEAAGQRYWSYSLTYENERIVLTAGDGRQVIYYFETGYLTKVVRPEAPDVEYRYNAEGRLAELSYPLEQRTTITYDDEGRVSVLHEPLDRVTQFAYKLKVTDIRNKCGILTRFVHRYGRPVLIQYFDQHDQPHHSTRYQWDGVELITRSEYDTQGAELRRHEFHYDVAGNIINEYRYGDLTGSGKRDCHHRTFCYSNDGFNLVTAKGDCKGNQTTFQYLPETNKLTHSLVWEKQNIRRRSLYEYNASGVCTAKIEDDGCAENGLEGVTECHISRTTVDHRGLPIAIEQYYLDQEEHPLNKEQITYDLTGRVLTRTYADGDVLDFL